MALHLNFPCLLNCSTFKPSVQTESFPVQQRNQCHKLGVGHILCHASSQTQAAVDTRRSTNYPPNIWNYDSLQSLQSDYTGKHSEIQANKLKEIVKQMLDDESAEPLARLEMIDDIQRLGLGYHYEREIKRALDTISNTSADGTLENDLHATALRFRTLRQHGYQVSPDVFAPFKNSDGNFKPIISKNVKGLLSLYEASYFGLQGENILEEAKVFAIRHLKEISKDITDPNLAKQVSRALELPLHWRMPRGEARWYIDLYEGKEGKISELLKLAKLDFNMVQAVYQKDLADLIRWWNDLGLKDTLEFARDRMVESLIWGIGMAPEPKFSRCRKSVAIATALVSVIDDVYDIYGSLEELELLSDAIARWDANAMEELPHYIKICFLALYKTLVELGYDNLKENGFDSLPYLKQAWADLCKAYLTEATLYHGGGTQTFEQYVSNAWISISGVAVIVHAYFALNENYSKEASEYLIQYPDLIRWSSLICRFANDLETAENELGRGDVLKSVQCYMRESGTSAAAARQHIWNLIGDKWQKINGVRVADPYFSTRFVEAAINFARAAHFLYQNGDGHGSPDKEHEERAVLLLIEPIPMD